jgi:hypothetical protein
LGGKVGRVQSLVFLGFRLLGLGVSGFFAGLAVVFFV